MIKIQQKQVIDVSDWDNLVEKTFGRPYSLQQQDGCMERCHLPITVPLGNDVSEYDYENDAIPEEVNGEEMGVSFAAWLSRDPSKKVGTHSFEREMFWHRNFYPSLDVVAQALYEKGLLPAGDYEINIDW